eukprot:789841_1
MGLIFSKKKKEQDEPWLTEHRDMGDGGYRAAIFGFTDGLVTNLCLILGVQMALEDAITLQEIIITGFAGLISGAFSMAVGEYISMSSEGEAQEHELKVEEMHLTENAEFEEQELSDILKEYTLKDETIKAILNDLRKADDKYTLDLHARLELGIDPEDQGAPIKAGIASFTCWCLGAITPMIPYFAADMDIAWIIALCICVIGSFGLGYVLGYFSKINKIWSGIRQFGSIAISAGCALGIGFFVQNVIRD